MKKGFVGVGVAGLLVFASQAWAADSAQDILKEGLLGAGVGAISAGASGGKAGKGALIGAGTSVIGNALFGFLGSSNGASGAYAQPAPSYAQPVYAAPAPVAYQPVETVYVQPQYAAPAPVADPSKQILKQGLLGAGTGAIAASASGGKAGTGALIGAGTNVIGGALFDTVFSGPSQQQPAYYYAPQQPQPAYAPAPGLKKHVIRKFDTNGNVVSEQEIWQ